MEHYPERLQGSNLLFQPGHGYGNIVLNFQQAAMSEFGVYAHAFHLAGQALFQQMFASNYYNGAAGCPIIFLYRHALELYLKAIVLHGETIMQIQGKMLLTNQNILQKHTLALFFPLLKQTFKAVGWTWDLEIEGLRSFDDVETLLHDFDTVDVGSYTFRYPVDTKGNPSVPHHFSMHLPTFCERMDGLLSSLEAAAMALEAIEEHMLETASYEQEAMKEFEVEPGDQDEAFR